MRRKIRVKRYVRSNGTSVRSHSRRRVKRRLTRESIQALSEFAKSDREHGFGFDWDKRHTDLEGISITRGEEESIKLPQTSALFYPTPEGVAVFRRDFEVVAHTHPPMKKRNVMAEFPSRGDIISTVLDMKRQYSIVFIADTDQAFILHIPHEQQKKVINRLDTKEKLNKERQMNKRDWRQTPIYGSKPTAYNQYQMNQLMKKMEKRYGMTITKVSKKELEQYGFHLIPQDGPNDRLGIYPPESSLERKGKKTKSI